MPIDLRASIGGGTWVQSEKDTTISGTIPVGTPANTWVTVASVNQECLVLYAGTSRDLNSIGTTSMRLIRDGVEFGSISSSSAVTTALVGRVYYYSSNIQLSGVDIPLRCKDSLEIQVKNSEQTVTNAVGGYSLSFSKGEML